MLYAKVISSFIFVLLSLIKVSRSNIIKSGRNAVWIIGIVVIHIATTIHINEVITVIGIGEAHETAQPTTISTTNNLIFYHY